IRDLQIFQVLFPREKEPKSSSFGCLREWIVLRMSFYIPQKSGCDVKSYGGIMQLYYSFLNTKSRLRSFGNCRNTNFLLSPDAKGFQRRVFFCFLFLR